MATKNLGQLRERLIKSIEDLDNDLITPSKANAGANLIGKFLKSLDVEMHYAEMHGKTPKIDYIENQSID